MQHPEKAKLEKYEQLPVVRKEEDTNGRIQGFLQQ